MRVNWYSNFAPFVEAGYVLTCSWKKNRTSLQIVFYSVMGSLGGEDWAEEPGRKMRVQLLLSSLGVEKMEMGLGAAEKREEEGELLLSWWRRRKE
jgi:hypothetical protein